MLQWALYVLVVSLAMSVAGALAEHALRRRHLPTRSVWLVTLGLSVVLAIRALPAWAAQSGAPTLEQRSTNHQPVMLLRLPDVAAAAVSGGHAAALMELEHVFPAISLGLSLLMLIGLTSSALYVYQRRRQWPMRMVESQCVRVSKDIGPAVIGLLRPNIVLPEWVLGRTPGERALIVAHETSHLLARDPLSITAALLAVLLLPWDPLLWWQLHRLRHAIEVDCDARVLESGHELTSYGEALIEVSQRRSRYLGPVAAMSEKRTLLEKRIEIMSQRNRKPWTLSLAALIGTISLSIAMGATQVTTPDTNGRAVLTLDTATLDRYVGNYKIGSISLLTIARQGNELSAKITGQPTFPIYPDGPTDFHWRVVSARVTFSGNANGAASTATIHQNGADIVASRVDDSATAQTNQQLAGRIAANQAQAGTEAALRKTIAALGSGSPNYDDMSEPLQSAVRQQRSAMDAVLPKLGAVRAVEFRGVSDGGADKYLVTHQTGKQSQWLIQLGSDNRISLLALLPMF